jgi:hypothetical protein
VKSGADAVDDGFDLDRPTVVRVPIGTQAARPQTTAAASVFGLAGQRRVSLGLTPPDELPVVSGPPPQRRSGVPPSRLARIFGLLKVDEGRALSAQEARSLAAWARAHGHKVIRRTVAPNLVHCWRAPD